MKTKCIGVRSVTYAQKAQEVLKKYGIRGFVRKRTDSSSSGCGWCIEVPSLQSETARNLLKNNGVSVTGEIYDLP